MSGITEIKQSADPGLPSLSHEDRRNAAKRLFKGFDTVFSAAGVVVNHRVLAPRQEVPWHDHTHVGDTLYVMAGEVTVCTRPPERAVRARPGQVVETPPGQLYRVVNLSTRDVSILLIQGVGEYDFRPAEPLD